MKEERKVKFKVFRGNPANSEAGRYDTYEFPASQLKGRSILQVLFLINEKYDGGLAFYGCCRRGVCVDCMMRVNGKPKLACLEPAGQDVTLEPLSPDRAIKDLLMGSPREEDIPAD